MKIDTTFIILGATGDLTKRKLIPALYRLVKNKKLENFALVGAARDETTMTEILASAKKFAQPEAKTWKKADEN